VATSDKSSSQPSVKPSPPKPSTLAGPLLAAALVTLFFSLLAFFGSVNPYVDLLAHFRVQYALLMLIAVLLALLVRSWRVTVVAVAPLAINAAVIVPLYLPVSSAAIDESIPLLKVVSFNVKTSNRSYAAAAEYLLRASPEIILLLETDNAWLQEIGTRLEGYRQIEGQAQDNNFGLVMFVRGDAADLAVEGTTLRDLSGIGAGPAIHMHCTWHGQPLSILGIHPVPPMNERNAASRDADLEAVARWSRDQRAEDRAALVIGDFNATPWSYAFRKLLREGNLQDSERGFGVQPTFKANWPQVIGIPIDHCLHSDELKIIERSVDSSGHGSDHRPLMVRVGWVE
jgi:endonuclease/exonuclease/phosphatase (EEP) superfamily protein YafD